MKANLRLQERDLGDEYGWKQIHGDVFRPAPHPLLFAALIGSGAHVLAASLAVVLIVMLGDLYTE